jgi:hypothetical protein
MCHDGDFPREKVQIQKWNRYRGDQEAFLAFNFFINLSKNSSSTVRYETVVILDFSTFFKKMLRFFNPSKTL